MKIVAFMKKTLVSLALVVAAVGLAFSQATSQDIAGDWNGTLKINGAELRLVLHVSQNADGTLTSKLDSIDQGANGIPVNSTTLKDSQLQLSVDVIHATYAGKVNADGSEIDGTWTQGS